MATSGRQRRGWSPESQDRRKGENLSGSLWEQEARLRQLRCLNPWQDADRLAALEAFTLMRPAWARWLNWDALAAQQAEGATPQGA